MELLTVNRNQSNGHIVIDEASYEQSTEVSTDKPFIQANTEEVNLQEIKDNHIIPVFIKDNEPLISHSDFIEATLQMASEVYAGETILSPNIRVSHPIKGRIPEAKNKPANELMEHEKTSTMKGWHLSLKYPPSVMKLTEVHFLLQLEA